MSSWSPAKAQDELNKLIEANEVQYNRGLFGCCMKYYVTFPNDNHKYCYNRDKLITNKLFKKVFNHLYSMSTKSSNKNNNVKSKNMYVHSLTDDFKKIDTGEIKNVDIDLTKINIKQAVRLVKQSIDDKKLAVKLNDDRLYMLNDNTINKLEKGLIDENADVNDTTTGSDEEVKSILGKVDKITIKVIEPEPDKDKRKRMTGKTRPGGGFFKHLNNTIFDFSKYGIFNEINSNNYNDNCLYLACKEAGMSDKLLQMLKIFVMNRIVPKCKLKEICEHLQICFKLTSGNKDGNTRTETTCDKKSNLSHRISR